MFGSNPLRPFPGRSQTRTHTRAPGRGAVTREIVTFVTYRWGKACVCPRLPPLRPPAVDHALEHFRLIALAGPEFGEDRIL